MLSEGGMYQFSILCCGITIIAIVINRLNRKMSNLTQSLVYNCSAAQLFLQYFLWSRMSLDNVNTWHGLFHKLLVLDFVAQKCVQMILGCS